MKNKLGIFITLGVVLLLVITTLVLALVKVNYMPTFKQADAIQIYQSSKEELRIDPNTDKEIFDNLMNEYNCAFSQSLLSAIFSGQTATAMKGNGILESVSKPSASLEFILHFNQAQNLIVYGVKQAVPITDVVVQLSNTSGYTTTKVYFKRESATTYYVFSTYINQSSLYSAVNTLVTEKN